MSIRSPKNVDQAKEIFRPKKPDVEKKELSSFFPKDSIFTKRKIYLLKKREAEEQNFEADWRNLYIGGKKITLIKGLALSKIELTQFDKDAKTHYLEERKKSVAKEAKIDEKETVK